MNSTSNERENKDLNYFQYNTQSFIICTPLATACQRLIPYEPLNGKKKFISNKVLKIIKLMSIA